MYMETLQILKDEARLSDNYWAIEKLNQLQDQISAEIVLTHNSLIND